MPRAGEIDYTDVLSLDLGQVGASVAGPKRPQDRIELDALRSTFLDLLGKPVAEGGYGKAEGTRARVGGLATSVPMIVAGGGEQDPTTVPVGEAKNTSTETETEMMNNRPTPDRVGASAVLDQDVSEDLVMHHGDVVIAAITSCTNTSNPSVMLAAGLLAKKAVERGLGVPPWVKTSLAPGSRVVTDYLQRAGLQAPLDRLRFHLVGYGCTTCIGNSGPLDPRIEETIVRSDLVAASVLSGNRNFEARVHQNVKANFLMSPPLVVAFALAGRVDIDMSREPLGQGRDGRDVFLSEVWPTLAEVQDAMRRSLDPETFRRLYAEFADQNPLWNEIPSATGLIYDWAPSTYIQEPPFFAGFSMEAGHITEVTKARALAIFGDSVTTDHISPAGAIKPASPAGRYLVENGVEPQDFNSYGSRRGNDRIMTRGTFANVRIKNLMVGGVEGGVTLHQPTGEQMSIYDAAMKYRDAGVPLVVLAGQEYGTGSSRDWAAKGTALLGVRAVVARSFERIHRSNLVGMGVLPLQFEEGTSAQTLGLDGTETFDVVGFGDDLEPRKTVTLRIHRANKETTDVPVRMRIDTAIEVEYYRHGGILQYVLRQLIRNAN
jgi:aconitate hydratase